MMLGAVGCAEASLEPQIDSRVHVVSNAPMMAAADRLVFSAADGQALLDRQPGDLVVGGNGTGFLRRVVGVQQQGDQIVVMTAPAALSDALVQADYGSQLVDDKSDLSGPSLDGVFVGLGDTELEAGGNVTAKITSGQLSFHPGLDLQLQVRDHAVQRFDLVASGALDADLAIHVEGNGATDATFSKELWESPSKTFVQMVGYVPVVEVVKVVVTADVDIGSDDGIFSLDVGASGHAQLDVGKRYIDGTWYSANGHTLTLDRSGPTFTGSTSAHVAVDIGVELEVNFYDLAGPFVSFAPKLEADYVPGQGVTAAWGLEGEFGGQIDVLGAGNDDRLAGFDGTLFDFTCDFGKSVQECLSEEN